MMFREVLRTEFLKLRRAKITWISWLALEPRPWHREARRSW
jgi:hypothetical protein